MQIGDTIQLRDDDYHCKESTTGIPPHLIKHGLAPPKGSKGEIVGVYGDYYLVRMEYGVTLGYKAKSLELIESSPKVSAYEIF